MTEKNYTLSVHDDHVYVERAPNAEVAMADQKVMIEEIMQTCRETGCRNVIVAGAAVKVGLSTLDLLQSSVCTRETRSRWHWEPGTPKAFQVSSFAE